MPDLLVVAWGIGVLMLLARIAYAISEIARMMNKGEPR